MEGNDYDLLKSDISDDNKMTDSNLEDDTEDYIQPSQPLSFQSSGPETISRNVYKTTDNMDMSMSTIEETLPLAKSAVLTEENSDFIQSSDNSTKQPGESFQSVPEDGCTNKFSLADATILKVTPDLFSTQSQLNDTVDVAHLKIDQTLLESSNVLTVPESPHQINESLESETSDAVIPETGKPRVLEETTTEDSLRDESVELSALNADNKTPLPEVDENKTDDSNKGKEVVAEEEEDPSLRFTDSSGMTSLLRTDNNEESVREDKSESQEAALDDTVDVKDIECYGPSSSEKTDVEVANVIPPVTEGLTTQVDSDSDHTPRNGNLGQKVSRLNDVLKNISEEELNRLQKHSTPENPLSQSLKINESTSSIENGTPQAEEDDEAKPCELTFTMYLQLECQVLIDPLKNQPISKKILGVKELVKRQPKQIFLEPNSDSPFKTKRFSSSSSGSVYSDKTGLPFNLPDRCATGNSSNSSVDFDKEIKAVNREVWLNEYLIPLALDEILPAYIEQSRKDLTKKDNNSKRKVIVRVRKKSHWCHPLDNVLESSMTEQSSENNSDVQAPDPNESDNSKPSDVAEGSDCKPTEEHSKQEGESDEVRKNELELKNIEQSPKKLEAKECGDDFMTEGSLIFARWTDKRYYSGRLNCRAKYDRWEVKFDDNTSKVIREDLILPLSWLTKGELVFALVSDKYMSGKILDIVRRFANSSDVGEIHPNSTLSKTDKRREEDVKFKIELDNTNEEVIINKSDICLNDVMAGIIREKFKPTNKSNLPVKSDIDFDNVVVGKRVREQRTPIRTGSARQPGSSTTKKRRGALTSSEELSADKITPKTKTPLRKRDLSSGKSEKRKSAKRGLHSEIDGEQNNSEPASKTAKEALPQSSGKSEGVKKRGRELKYDTEKCGSSSKKSKPSQNVRDSEGSEPPVRRGRKSSKALITEFESAIGDSVEKRDDGDVEDSESQKQNKPGRTPKAKDEKNQGRGGVRSGRKPLSTGKRKTKKT